MGMGRAVAYSACMDMALPGLLELHSGSRIICLGPLLGLHCTVFALLFIERDDSH